MTNNLKTINTNPKISQWSSENGYKKRFSTKEYPYRLFNSNQLGSLMIMLRLKEQDLDYLCYGSLQGYKIILRLPGEILKTSRHAFYVPPLTQAYITIKPRLTTTSEELRNIKPNRRQCFFHSERQLCYFKLYTQHTCETECLANFTKIECGCVKFSMPSKCFFYIFHVKARIALQIIVFIM